jgi:probable HAF family extracellular repeat protein
LYTAHRWRVASAAITLVFGVLAFANAFADVAPRPITYNLTDLGTLGGEESVAFSINNSGQVTGWSEAPGVDSLGIPIVHAFLYTNAMTDLGTLAGDSDSVGLAINSSGNITGYAAPNRGAGGSSSGTDAILIDPATNAITDLGTLYDSWPSYGSALNDGNVVTGYSFTGLDGVRQPFLYATAMEPIGAPNAYAFGTNNASIVVGSEPVEVSDTQEPDVATYFINGTPTIFGPEGGVSGTPYSYGMAINNAASGAQIAGYFDYDRSNIGTTGSSEAFLYDLNTGTLTKLGIPFASDCSLGFGLNDNGVVVGTAFENNETRGYLGAIYPSDSEIGRAAIYEDGSAYYLDDLLTGSNTSGTYLAAATSINDSGQIVGFAQTPSGATHAVLLTPTTITASTPAHASKLMAVDVPDIGIELQWSDNSGGHAYTNIEASSGSGYTSVGLEYPGVTNLLDSAVSPGVTYTFRAVAQNSVGNAAPSNTVTATYTAPAPSITSISPISTPANKLVVVTVNGSNFILESVVQIDGVGVGITFNSPNQILAEFTPSELKAPGPHAITVFTPNGGGVSNAAVLTAIGPRFTVSVGTITRMTVLSVPVKVTNSGNAAGDAVTVTSAVLGTADTTSTLPVVLGTIGAGANASTTLVFPTTAGKSGKK